MEIYKFTKKTKLKDKKYFQIENGIWTGTEAPFRKISILRNTNFDDKGYFDFSNVAEIEIEAKHFPRKSIRKNDILIERSGGGPNTPVGRVSLYDKEDDIFSFSNFTSRLRVINDEIDPNFIHIQLLHFHLNKYTEKIQTQTTNIRNLEFDKYTSLEIKLPENKLEQNRIANEIKQKLAYIEQMYQASLKQKEAVEALQGSLLREVFHYKKGEELPKGWKWEKVDNVAKINITRKKKRPENLKEPTSFVPMDSVDDVTGKITKTLFRPFDELGQSYTYFENKDIIFAKITPCMQNGKCAIVNEMKNDFGYGSSEYIVLTPVKEAYTRWVHYFLRTVEFRKAAEDHFTGSAGQQRVPTDFIQKYPVPLPEDEKVIERLCDELDRKHIEYFDLLKQSATQLEAIESLPAAILREVFDFKENNN